MFGLFGKKEENTKPQACDLPFLCWQCENQVDAVLMVKAKVYVVKQLLNQDFKI